MSIYDDPAADVVEVIRGDELDLVALIGATHGVAFVSIADGDQVRVSRRRADAWRCDEHGYASPSRARCRHIDSAIHAANHLDREDYAVGAVLQARCRGEMAPWT